MSPPAAQQGLGQRSRDAFHVFAIKLVSCSAAGGQERGHSLLRHRTPPWEDRSHTRYPFQSQQFFRFAPLSNILRKRRRGEENSSCELPRNGDAADAGERLANRNRPIYTGGAEGALAKHKW